MIADSLLIDHDIDQFQGHLESVLTDSISQ